MKKFSFFSLILCTLLLFSCTLLQERTIDFSFTISTSLFAREDAPITEPDLQYKIDCELSGAVQEKQEVLLYNDETKANFTFNQVPLGKKIIITVKAYEYISTNDSFTLKYEGSDTVLLNNDKQVQITLETPKTQGSKKTYNIGDLILSDGSVIPYDETRTSFTFENGISPVAVIFRAGEEGSALGVGLKQKAELAWTSSTTLQNINITDIQCTENASKIEGDTDGSDNWEQIYEFFNKQEQSQNKEEGQKIDNYPAFKFAKNYTTDGDTNLKETEYSDNWFLPSIEELITLKQNLTMVNNVLGTLGTSRASKIINSSITTFYWSSSQVQTDAKYAYYYLFYQNGSIAKNDKTIDYTTATVCVVRKF